jgi:peptidoglycan/xylan/chitin deacetylase (PgdA/CDA1 family)
MNHGAVIRTDSTENVISLVFTGHEYADGYETIRFVLDHYGIKASFFFTGDFYRNPDFQKIIRTLRSEGHYLGAHSDKHLLYCSWEDRDQLLVSKDSLLLDLENNYEAMRKAGVRKKEAPYFMPPYEWYNDSISQWTQEDGLTLINFTPGTSSNADYTYPELGSQYLDSQTILDRILQYESEHNLNGSILLLHIGADPRRKDKFYNHLDALLTQLQQRGYTFATLWESMQENQADNQ